MGRDLYTRAHRTLEFLHVSKTLLEFYASYENPVSLAHADVVRRDRDRVLNRLVKNTPILPPRRFVAPDEWKRLIDLRARKSELLRLYGNRSEMTAYQRSFVKLTKLRSDNARCADHVTRLVWAQLWASRNGWYPVFVTLTVAQKHYDDVFAHGSRHWPRYIRNVQRACARAAGYPKSQRDTADVHSYFAVVERGGRTGRLHVHVLHLCKAMPIPLVDPNAGRRIPNHREMMAWRKFWSYGIAQAVAVRTVGRDIYARQGWVWPVKYDQRLKCYQPYPARGVGAVASYIGDYITKQKQRSTDEWKSQSKQTLLHRKTKARKPTEMWRTKMSRNFGLQDLLTEVRNLTIRELWMISRGTLPPLFHNSRRISPHLLKQLCVKEMCRRYPSTMSRMYSELAPAPGLLRSMESGTFLTPSTRSLGDFKWLQAKLAQPKREMAVSGHIRSSY